MPRAPRALAAAAALLAACASARPPRPAGPAAAAPGWTRTAFAVPEHGKLLLSLPPGWLAKEGERGEAGAAGIRIDGPDGAFRIFLTPLWNPGEPEGAEARADTARLFADVARRKALGGSVEREIPLEELSGPGVKGFWFAATDRELVERAPGPDEWRNILQGAAAVGPVLLAFTLLDNGPGPQRRHLLEVVRSARHAASGETLNGTVDGGVVQGNGHAFLHRDGLCVNVHVSKASPEPGDWERIEAILATVRFGEDL